MNAILKDFKFGFRHWSRNPSGTLVILGTLALVMSATCLILATIKYESKRFMPFPDPNRVVKIWNNSMNGVTDSLPARIYGEGKDQFQTLESIGVSGMTGMQVLMASGLEPASLSVTEVSSTIFDVCATPPY